MKKNKILSKITSREKEILKLLAKGLTTEEIGQKLKIANTTVITHRIKLRKKLGCKNSAQLIYKAVKIGLL